MRGAPFALEGRRVLVTGGTRGIGRACAIAFAKVGAEVAITSRTLDSARKAADEIAKETDADVLGFACDVSKEAAVAALFKSLRTSSKAPLAAVANVAGYEVEPRWWTTPLHEMDAKEVAKAVETVAAVDLGGSRWVTYHALPWMLRQGSGSLVYVSSTPALTGYQGFPYTEAKAGILGLMRDVARVYGPKGIRANAVAPGNIRTGWLDEIPIKERKKLEKENPLQRFGEPEEVANVILFLASGQSSFVTGETIVIDGGTVIR